MSERRLELVADRRRPSLANAAREIDRSGLRGVPVVDVDLHLHGLGDPGEVRRYIRHANLRRLFTTWESLIPPARGDPRVAGRVQLPPPAEPGASGGDRHPTAARLLRTMDELGADLAVVFHAPLLFLAQHPEVEVETELAWAFARWLVEDVLPGNDRLRTFLYLPITDPEASLELIGAFADRPGVAGFLITALNYLPLHRNLYLKVFAALDERALPLAVHTVPNWEERPFAFMERFVGPHALGTPFYGMVHLFNLVTAGIPERFPGIRWIWIEAGQSWITFAASRLDNEYRQRPSEAPLLTRLPSEYIRRMHFATHPLETELPEREARVLFEYVGGARNWLYSSGYPSPDFDLPTRVWELPYLSEEEKRAILGGNAIRLLGLPEPVIREPGLPPPDPDRPLT